MLLSVLIVLWLSRLVLSMFCVSMCVVVLCGMLYGMFGCVLVRVVFCVVIISVYSLCCGLVKWLFIGNVCVMFDV